ncbi:TPA: glutamate 5-kinase [Candidatus Peribacteria bacterium]|nr:glutamate 5-kinase [Candidatus Peribacteria bacterium]HAS33948.1 glutamate 5-kinase [Candidatus Peribacteria bacterium]
MPPPMADLGFDNITVVKIGSSTLAHESGLDLATMRHIVTDIAQLVRENIAKVVMVSSGSVRIGKHSLGDDVRGLKTGKATLNQVCSTIGQADLIHAYQDLFHREGLDIAQGLITRRDFSIRQRYESMRDVLLTLLRVNRIPILNDNDLLTDEETDFTDNDHFAAYVSAMLDAQRLIILSDVEGLLDGPPRAGGKVISQITDAEDAKKYLWARRKDQSSGGMPSKIDAAILMREFGIPLYLVNGKKPGVIGRVMRGEHEGTFFSSDEPVAQASQLQRWLRVGAVGTGKIELSTVIADLLRHGRRASVLSIGIEKILAPFKKGDIIDVCDESGSLLGRGVAQIDADGIRVGDERELDGRSKSPIVIHWEKFGSTKSVTFAPKSAKEGPQENT